MDIELNKPFARPDGTTVVTLGLTNCRTKPSFSHVLDGLNVADIEGNNNPSELCLFLDKHGYLHAIPDTSFIDGSMSSTGTWVVYRNLGLPYAHEDSDKIYAATLEDFYRRFQTT